MKKRNKLMTVAGLVALTSASFAASVITKEHGPSAKEKSSISQYKMCDTKAIAETLTKQFDVAYLPDKVANYSYYMATDTALNVDRIRSAVCQYIVKNKCRVFWGNVINIAMFSDQKAPWFPADTSPHYTLSPSLTCGKLVKKEGKKTPS